MGPSGSTNPVSGVRKELKPAVPQLFVSPGKVSLQSYKHDSPVSTSQWAWQVGSNPTDPVPRARPPVCPHRPLHLRAALPHTAAPSPQPRRPVLLVAPSGQRHHLLRLIVLNDPSSVRLLTCLSALRSVHPPTPHRRSLEAAFVRPVGLGPQARARPRAGAQETQLSERAKDLKGHWRLSPASTIDVLMLSCPQDTRRRRPGCATAQNVGVRSQLHVYLLCGLSVPICAKDTAKEAGAGPFSVPGPVLSPKHLPSTRTPAHYYDDPRSSGQKLSPEESSGCPRRHDL